MRIVCPSCSAAYDIPDTLLTGREAVRCARCSQEWHPTEAQPAPEPEPEPRREPVLTAVPPRERSAPPRPVIFDVRTRELPEDTGWGALAIDRLMAAPRAKPRAPLELRFAWIGSLALVLGLLVAGYAWRAEIMTAWPPSVRLYVAIGLARVMP